MASGPGTSGTGSSVRDAIASTEPRVVCVPSLYTLKHGVDSKPEPGIIRSFDICLRLDGKGAYYENATSWNQVRHGGGLEANFFMVQLCMLFMEQTHTLGGLMCLVDPQENGALYASIVRSMAKIMIGNPANSDIKRRKDYTKCGHYVDRRFAHDIKYEVLLIKYEERMANKEEEDEDEEDDEEEGEKKSRKKKRRINKKKRAAKLVTEQRALPIAVPSETFQEWSARFPWMATGRFMLHACNGVRSLRPSESVDIPLPPGTGGIMEHFTDAQLLAKPNEDEMLDADYSSLLPPPENNPPTYVDPPPQEEAGGDNGDEPPNREEFLGKNRVSKIDMTVTPIPYADAEKKDQMACLIVRFLVRDEALDIGKFIHLALANNQSRSTAHKSTGRYAQGGHVEMFPNYTHLLHSNHPAGVHFDEDTYIRCLEQLKPELFRGKTKSEFAEQLDYINSKKPTHLANVLTIESALTLAAEAGARLSCLNPHQWLNRGQGLVMFPSTLTTYKPLAQQVFWWHPTKISFREYYFYHVQTASDFIRGLCNGANMEHFFETGEYESPEHVQQAVNDAFGHVEHLLSSQATVDRATLVASKLVRYETHNEFIHLNAEAQIIYKKVKQYRPAHSLQTLRDVQLVIAEHGRDNWTNWVSHTADAAVKDLKRMILELKSHPHYLPNMKNTQLRYDDAVIRNNSIEATAIKIKIERGKTIIKKMDQLNVRIEEWRSFEKRLRDYENYTKLVVQTQCALVKKFCSLWQTTGDIDQLPVPDPIKNILVWYRDNEAKFPNITRDFQWIDPEIDAFGNSMIRTANIYVWYARVLQPLICMLSEGLFSAYDADLKELSFHMMCHGRYDVGKTFTAIKTLIDFTCIPGTVSEHSLQTRAADTTKKHMYDQIVASDEAPRWLTSKSESEKPGNKELEDKEKIKLTRGQITQKTFVFVKLPNGDSIRWNEDTVSDHKKACVYVTNAEVESKEALSSRMFRITVKQSKTPANEMEGEKGPNMTADSQIYQHLLQMISAGSRKMMQVGGMFPEVEMWLFNNISNKILHYLREWNAIPLDVGSRSLDIIRPYVRQLCIRMAQHCVWDMPGKRTLAFIG